jgi:SAM-dependent methyltransferase
MDLHELPDRPFTRHPWEVARASFFTRLLRGNGLLNNRIDVLDVGAGDGYLACALAEEMSAGGTITCFDVHYTDAFLDQAVDGPIRFTRTRPQAEFDLLLLLDVVEHIEDDEAFLRDMVHNLRPGGHVVVSVPAFMSLFSWHDLRLGHYRRYRAGQLWQLVRAAGLSPLQGGGLFHCLLGPRALQKLGELLRGARARPDPAARVEGETDAVNWRGGRLATALVGGMLRLDNTVSLLAARAGLRLPGLSVWVLARRP